MRHYTLPLWCVPLLNSVWTSALLPLHHFLFPWFPPPPTSTQQQSYALFILMWAKRVFPLLLYPFILRQQKSWWKQSHCKLLHYHKWKCLPLPCARVDHEQTNGLITKICLESVKAAPCANVWCSPAETIQSFCTVSNLLLNKAEKNLHLKMLSCI